jgi:hypothetical protein
LATRQLFPNRGDEKALMRSLCGRNGAIKAPGSSYNFIKVS